MTDIASLEPTHSVQYGGRRLAFLWRQRTKRPATGVRKARIHVHPNGLVEVETPPETTLSEAKQALLKRAQWVSKHLRDIEARTAEVLEREYVSGETVFYLGRRYILKVTQSNEQEPVKLLRGRICIDLASPNIKTVKAALDSWYQNRAKIVLSRRLESVAERLPWIKETPPLSIRPMKTQWGSCSPNGRIALNPQLVKAPTRCIDYVIIHELCHLIEHNHSVQFYQLLIRAMPDWEKVKANLDGMSELLLNE